MWWKPKFKYLNLLGTADIVAAVAGKKIRLLALHLNEQDHTADVSLTIQDGNGGAALAQFTGMDLGPPMALQYSRVGWFETTAGNALYGAVAGTTPDLNLCLVYVEI